MACAVNNLMLQLYLFFFQTLPHRFQATKEDEILDIFGFLSNEIIDELYNTERLNTKPCSFLILQAMVIKKAHIIHLAELTL